MKHIIILLLVLFLAMLVSTSAYAQEEGPTPSPDQVNAIARNLYCPVCANVPLDACGTAACAQWRQQIADLLTKGYSEQQIYDYFAQYGSNVLATPPAAGFNWLIYLLPPAAILIAAVYLGKNLTIWSQRSARKPLKKIAASDKYSRLLEKQLKERR
jgi:cytochrome c-type biogenesis protein CcmH